ncbi:MAG: hypothetical protein PW844_05865 [Pantoea sp.]|uniref:hypothetical protein n=1 Tax=Pantoea sp. TaxID=69393 RepID=UPI00239F83B1|nr:hypothetical protein [Pantoea sp.]MDE1185994.1 hypothetical protein [Pantoea sp.]
MKLTVRFFVFLISLLIFFGVVSRAKAEQDFSSYETLETVSNIFSDAKVVSGLKLLLGTDYAIFSENFDVFGQPHKTDEGGIFVEGWLKDLYLEQASAFVIQPNGKIYVGWIVPNDSKVNYRSNDDATTDMQKDIKVWSVRFKNTAITDDYSVVGRVNTTDRYFETKRFRVKLTALCPPDNENCNDVAYEGIRKSDGAVLRLTGKATRSECREKVCPILSYKFHNHDAIYIVNALINNLSVIVNNKMVLSEDGIWMDKPLLK